MGKYINGIYCTGKSVQMINEELAGQFVNESIRLHDLYGNIYEIPLSSISFKADYTSQLNAVQNSQTVLGWGLEALSGGNRTISPTISFSTELLWDILAENGFLDNNRKEPVVEIRRGENGYYLHDGRKNALNEDKLITCITKYLKDQQFEMDLSGCYVNLPYTDEMKHVMKTWEKVEAFQNRSIVYDMGDEKITLTPAVTADFLKVDKEGNFQTDSWPAVSEEGIRAFTGKLAEEFDTYGKEHVFQTTRGDLITISGGTYGNQIDQEAEVSFLMEYYGSPASQNESSFSNVHVPVYKREAYVRGKKDILDTYVEVDMSNQKLYYYEKGDLLLESDVVTGNISKKCDTPEGVNYVYGKQKNRTLKGPGYATFVYYWMPVNGNIGMHDATWRKEFGGEIYKTKGSHGCINLPKEKAKELYDMLSVGIPVVMFY